MVNNFRPVQPLYGRKISASYSEDISSHWGYSGKKGPNYWENICEKGKSQSPVDLTKQVFDQGSVSEPFNFANYELKLIGAKLKNNGHTVQLDSPSNFTAQISGGGLGGMLGSAAKSFMGGSGGGGGGGLGGALGGMAKSFLSGGRRKSRRKHRRRKSRKKRHRRRRTRRRRRLKRKSRRR